MTDAAVLAIEIGGTKLQWGVARPDGSWIKTVRRAVEPALGAEGILAATEEVVSDLAQVASFRAIGIGFGGPVDPLRGEVTTSHQIAGWDHFPLVAWCGQRWNVPTVVGNDCDVAALAEARGGAGKGSSSVLFVTVGSGIGGGLVLAGELVGQSRPAVAEVGHLRLGLEARDARETVESVASGWGIARRAQALLANPPAMAPRADRDDLLGRCSGRVADLTGRMVAEAAAEGNRLAGRVITGAVQALGWAIAQVVTITAVEVVVIGGGVSQMPDQLFWDPLKTAVEHYVFPPLRGSYAIRPAAFGDRVVLEGARLLAQSIGDD